MSKNRLFSIVFLLFSFNAFAQIDHWESILVQGNAFNYLVPTSQPDVSWITAGFDDASWSQGNSGFGYGDNDDNTVLPDGTVAVYLRSKFNITDLSAIDSLVLHMDYDDGFVAYLNGTEIARDLVSGNPPNFDQFSDGLHEAIIYTENIPVSFGIDISNLIQGENILAVEVHNENTGSSDLTAIPILSVGINNQSNDYQTAPDWFDVPIVIDPNFTESTLPIVVITTNGGQEIVADPKITATIGIIYNGLSQTNLLTDPFNEYEGLCGIDIRGESSQWFDKKSYGFEMRDNLGADIDTTFLDFPSEEDFILYGPYADKSMINNRLAMKLANDMGHYASRTRFVELVINDDYKGVYVLMEKIKRDKNRIDVAKLTELEVTGDDLTGGYIIRIDKGDYQGWESQYDDLDGGNKVFFQYVYPAQEDIVTEQKNYIKTYFDGFEQAMASTTHSNSSGKHYTDYINLRSFVDNFIINELSKNVDAYRLSTYYYKNKDSKGGKITCGYWDFNLSFGNADYCGGADTEGWVYYQCGDGGYPFWWDKLLQDTLFTNALQCRWTELRQTMLSDNSLNQTIDGFVSEIATSQEKNYQRWPVLGTYLWPNPWYFIEPTTHEGIISAMKNWLFARTAWMDANIPGISQNCEIYEDYAYGGSEVLGIEKYEMGIYPNPANAIMHLVHTEIIQQVSISNLSGQVIGRFSPQSKKYDLDLSTYPTGVFLITLKTKTQIQTKRIVIAK